VSLALLEGIGDEKLTVDARVTLLRVLPAVGRYESVRPVAKLLSTTKNVRLREASRAALEAIPVVTAVKPLRDAMKTATGDFRVALVRSLGKRQDSLSVGLLLALTTSDERPLRLAVIAALAEIGDRSAHDVIESAVATATPEDRDAILTSYTRYAWRLGETAEGGASRRVFLKLTHMEKKWRVAGIEGLARAGIRKEAPLLLAFLDHADESTRLAARDALKKLRGSAQAIATIAVNSKTPVERRRELIDVLAARKDVAGVARFIVQGSSDPSASVRESSARALARLDVKTAGSQLIALLADGEASVREATSKALAVWNVDGARAFLESQRDMTTSDDVRRSLTLILERRKD
jgi:HEAT repeat protein